jgi:hypothetical protein
MIRKRVLAVLVLVAVSTFWLTSCTSPTSSVQNLSDGTAGAMAMEFTQMSDVSSAGLAKSAATEAVIADTIAYISQVIIQPWTYDPVGQWWTRSFQDSIWDGHSYLRTDSLQFADSASRAKQTMPEWVSSTGWTHIRHVSRQGNVNEFSSRFAMTVVVTKGLDTTATWNGSITGEWDSLAFSNDTVESVVRKFANVDGIRWWRFPSSGTIYINNPLRTWVVTFLGNGVAKALVTRKSDGKQETITIDLRTGKETA